MGISESEKVILGWLAQQYDAMVALPRLDREAPLNSIWEGSGNVMCLDVLRAARREPAAVEAFNASEQEIIRLRDEMLSRGSVVTATP